MVIQDMQTELDEFLTKLQKFRGKHGRDSVRHLRLKGWETLGEELDRLDGLYSELKRRGGKRDDSNDLTLEKFNETLAELRSREVLPPLFEPAPGDAQAKTINITGMVTVEGAEAVRRHDRCGNLKAALAAMRAADPEERPSLSVAAHAAGVQHPLQAVHEAAAKHSLMSAEAEYQRLMSTMSLADYDTWCAGEPDEIVIEHFAVTQCPDCNGSGRYVGCYVDNEPCRTCGGSGEVKRRL